MASGVKELEGRVGVRDMVRFDPFKIKVEKNFNPRVKETLRANIDRLKPMIASAGGVLQPLWVRRDGEDCILIDGESRLTAVKELIKEGLLPATEGKDDKPFGVPVLCMEGSADEVTRIKYAMTANGGAPLEKWEIGKNYARLINLGQTEEDIATAFGKTPQYIASCLALNDADDTVKHMLVMGEVSEGKAVSAVKKFGSKAAEHIAAAPKNAKGKVVRERKQEFDVKALVKAVRVLLADAAQQGKPVVFEIHSDLVRDVREAMKGAK